MNKKKFTPFSALAQSIIVGGFYKHYNIGHADHYGNKAIKLLRLHNETIEALNRYHRDGEQKVTVTHAVITDKAIVNNFNGVGGISPKNEGASPCSPRNAKQKQEPMSISHAASQPWQTEDAGSMEAKASDLKRN